MCDVTLAHLPGAQFELEHLLPVATGVELGAVRQPPRVVHTERVTGLGAHRTALRGEGPLDLHKTSGAREEVTELKENTEQQRQ